MPNMNEAELKHRLTKRLKRQLDDEEWEDFLPDHPGPFDQKDFLERLSILRKANLVKKRPVRTTIMTGSMIPHRIVQRCGVALPTIRRLLGLSAPLTLEKLDQKLMSYSASDSILILCYPVRIVKERVATLFHVKHIFLREDDENLRQFKTLVDRASENYHCHPAAVVAYFLCSRPITYDQISVYVQESGRVKLDLFGSSVSTRRLWEAYRLARQFQQQVGIEEHRRGSVDLQREKTILLAMFIESMCKGLTWQQRLHKWNEMVKNSGLEYASVDSMKVVYSRVKNHRREKKKDMVSFLKEEWGDTTLNPNDAWTDELKEILTRVKGRRPA